MHKCLYLRDRGIKPGNFYVLGQTRAPAVLVEFISNWENLGIILENKKELAKIAIESIRRYFD